MTEEKIISEDIAKPIEPTKSATVSDEGAKKPFSIEILRLIKDAQKQHGLRHGDFQRYRGKSGLCRV